jgi:hypothetical protein
MSRRSNNRAWYRNEFYDHPKASSNLDEAFVGTGTHRKARVFCRRCFDSCLAEHQARDVAEFTQGRLSAVRNNQAIETTRMYIIFETFLFFFY